MKLEFPRTTVVTMMWALLAPSDVPPETRSKIANDLQRQLDRDPVPVITPARYAKGMLAVRCPSPNDFKTRAARLIGDHLKARYSNREDAYIASPAKVKKFEALFMAGADASPVTGRLREVTR